MTRLRWRLQATFFAAIALMLAIVVLVMLLLWNRQQAARIEVSEATRAAMHALLSEQVRTDGEAEVRQLACRSTPRTFSAPVFTARMSTIAP